MTHPLVTLASKAIILAGLAYATWLTASLPVVWRLPSAPSLSRQATEPVPRLGPDGLQSTIAKEK